MRKIFTTIAIGIAALCYAQNDCPYEIKWTSGTSYASSSTISDMTVPSLSTVWGTFPEGTAIVVGQNKKVSMTGPDNYSRTYNLGQASKWDETTQSTVSLPAIKIVFKDAPLTLKTPGDYTASIPADAFTINGTGNEQFCVTFTVADNRVYTPTDLEWMADPAPGQYQTLNRLKVKMSILDKNGQTEYLQKGVKYGAKGIVSKEGGETKEYDIATSATETGYLGYRLVLGEGAEIHEDGVYTVTYPEGSFLIGSNSSSKLYTNKELTYTYTISSGTTMKPNITPAQGNVTALAGIELEAPENYYFSIADNAEFPMTLPDGTEKKCTATLSPNAMYIYLRTDSIEYAKGAYTVTIPQKSISFIGTDGNPMPTAGFTLKYSVSGGALGDLAYTVSDQNGEVDVNNVNTYSLESFYIKFDEDVTPTSVIQSKVKYPDGSVKYISTSWSAANKRFMIFMNYPKTKGSYEVTFPAGAACADGVFNKDIVLHVNYLEKNVEELACTSTPENGSNVESLKMLYINLDGDTYKSASPYNGGITMTYFYNDEISDPKDREMQYLKTSENPLQLYVVLDNEVTELGDYTWTIPENSINAVKKDGTQVTNTGINFCWSIRKSGGVSEAFAEDVTSFNVYSADGVAILKGATRDELNTLGKGLYIINGRTFIIR